MKAFSSKFKEFWQRQKKQASEMAGALHARKNQKNSSISLFKPHERKANFSLAVIINTIRVLVVIGLLVGCALLGSLLGVVQAYMSTTPPLDLEKIEDQAQTTFIYDAQGHELTPYKGLENRVWAPIKDIPIQLQNAFIAIEDERFRSHKGVDVKRLFGALINNLQNDSTNGGSTITQQLVKMRLIGNEHSYKRKIQEAYLAMQLEQRYSKDQILEAYLNTIPLGESNYGIKTAANDYFGKELNQLTLRECATLAGITRSPNWYDPRKNYYDRNKPEQTDDRTSLVLGNMYRNGFITKAQKEAAMQEKISVRKNPVTKKLYDMAYFIEYAISDVCTYMLKQRNLPDTKDNRTQMERTIRSGGYKIYTSVDPTVQHQLEKTILDWKSYPKTRYKRDQFNYTTNADGTRMELPQPQVAAVIMDWRTGQVKAMMGGRQLPTRMKEYNRSYQSTMPVGSSIKPIAVYGPALDKGASPASIFADIQAPVAGWGGDKGYPSNYDFKYTGPCTMRNGVRRSINMVAARTLFDVVGINTSTNYLVNMGVNRSHINSDGPGLALGTSGITPLEMAQAYSTVANKGYYQQSISFIRVEDSKGRVVLDPQTLRDRRQVFKPSSAWMLIDMMKDAVSTGGTGWRASFPNMTIAGKTGTNSEERGVFFSGITPYYVGTVWVGSDSYKPLAGSAGGSVCAPIWRNFMEPIHKSLQNKEIIADLPESLNLVKATVCSVSGKHATANCGKNLVTDWFLKSTVPQEDCDVHVNVQYCKDSGRLAGPYCPKDRLIKKPIILLPKGSVYSQAGSSILSTFFPNAYSQLPTPMDPLAIKQGDSRLKLYCNVHSAEKYQDVARDNAILEGQMIITRANRLLRENQSSLSQVQEQSLRDAMTRCMNLLSNPTSTAVDIINANATINGLLSQYLPGQS